MPTARRTVLGRPPPARVNSGTRAIPDSTTTFVATMDWLGAEGGDPRSIAERRAESLLASNAGLLADFGVGGQVVRRAGVPGVLFETSARVGALPLLSPISGRPDFGLVVEPRFRWSSAGDMLAGTGFRVLPNLLPLPDLPQSERRVPAWVLSSVILVRLQRLLDTLQRRFTMAEADLRSPRGSVAWDVYATSRLPVARALDVPCRYPDLRDDEELRSSINWVVRRHRQALLGQAAAGVVVRELLARCDVLLARLAGTPPRPPDPGSRRSLHRQTFTTRAFREGLEAIDWTVEERGLAGLSDLSGLPWRLDMEVFFEAWVEAIAERAARRTGAAARAGRKSETRVPLDWQPRAAGSQRSLLPDVVLARPDVVVVLDAKYKRHAEEIDRFGWFGADERLREQHRADVLQALAYSTLYDAPRVTACLVYPAKPDTWARMVVHGRVLSRARVRSGTRCVELALLAVPLSGDVDAVAPWVERLVREPA